MFRTSFKYKAVRSIAWRALLLAAGATALAALAPARANDPGRSEAPDAELTETWDTGPTSAGGTADLRGQLYAFSDQFAANMKEWLAGKITPDLVLESERFHLAADRNCCDTAAERQAATRASLKRLQAVHAAAAKKLAAGQIKRADFRQVESALDLVRYVLDEDAAQVKQEAARNR